MLLELVLRYIRLYIVADAFHVALKNKHNRNSEECSNVANLDQFIIEFFTKSKYSNKRWIERFGLSNDVRVDDDYDYGVENRLIARGHEQ